jgi:hypothetical protein
MYHLSPAARRPGNLHRLAQHERKVISERTKRALQTVKELEANPIRAEERRRRGKKPLGNPNVCANSGERSGFQPSSEADAFQAVEYAQNLLCARRA